MRLGYSNSSGKAGMRFRTLSLKTRGGCVADHFLKIAFLALKETVKATFTENEVR